MHAPHPSRHAVHRLAPPCRWPAEHSSLPRSAVWTGGTLVATSLDVDGKMGPVVVRRWVDPVSGWLAQETSYDGVTYRRVFERVRS